MGRGADAMHVNAVRLNEAQTETRIEPIIMDHAERQRLITAMAEAITHAERRSQNFSELETAKLCYESLLYDFPQVSSENLGALASCLRQSSSQNWQTQFPLKNEVMAGILFLAVQNQINHGNLSQESAERLKHIHTIAGFYLVKFPANFICPSPEEARAALSAALSSYHTPSLHHGGSIEEELEVIGGQLLEDGSVEVGRGEIEDHIMADEQDEDGCEWEPLEEGISSEPFILAPLHAARPPPSEYDASWQSLIGKLFDLSSHLRQSGLSQAKIWDDLQLVESTTRMLTWLLSIYSQLDQLQRNTAELTFQSYVDLLCEYCMESGSHGLVSVGSHLLLLSGNNFEAENFKQMAGMQFLSSLCSRVSARGREGEKQKEKKRVREDALFRREVWKLLEERAVLTLIGRRLGSVLEKVQGKRRKKGGKGEEGGDGRIVTKDQHIEISQMAEILTFYVKEAPGNAAIGAAVIESGVCRAWVSLFLALKDDPEADSFRRLTLLLMAASSEVSKYAIAVPGVKAYLQELVSSEDQSPMSLCWPLVTVRQLAGNSNASAERPLASLAEKVGYLSDSKNAMELSLAAGHLLQALALLHEVVGVAHRDCQLPLWQSSGQLASALSGCYSSIQAASKAYSSASSVLKGEEMNNEKGFCSETQLLENVALEVSLDTASKDKGLSNMELPVARQKSFELFQRLIDLLKPLVAYSRDQTCNVKSE